MAAVGNKAAAAVDKAADASAIDDAEADAVADAAALQTAAGVPEATSAMPPNAAAATACHALDAGGSSRFALPWPVVAARHARLQPSVCSLWPRQRMRSLIGC